MARNLRCLWLLVLWLASGTGAAQAAGEEVLRLGGRMAALPVDDHCRSWVDATGGLAVDEVEAADERLAWMPRHQQQLDRLGPGQALWMQFTAVIAPDGPWFLDLGSADLEEVRLYYRGYDGNWVVQEAGTSIPQADWPVPGRVPAFALSPEVGAPVSYWLRIAHSRTAVSAAMTVRSQASLLQAREREQFLLGAYAGMAALVALGAVVSGVRYRDRAFFAYLVYVVLLASGQLARLGVGAQSLWPESPAIGQAARVLLQTASGAAALWFVKVVTEPVRLSRKVDWALWGLIAAVLAAGTLDAAVASRATLTLSLGLTGLTLLVIAALILWAWRVRRDRDMRLIALGFLPILLMALFPLARALNLMPGNMLTRYGIFLGALLEMPILYYALSVRAHRRRESEIRAAALTHSDPLTGLALRRTLIERLDATLARVRSQHQRCALLVVRIANIEGLREDYGRDATEKAVVVTASHLMRAITVIDLAARVGDHEFALLLEAPVTPEVALSRAQQVVAGGLRQVDALPIGATLRFHVAVAMLPQGELDAGKTLQWALDALAQMPSDTRKLIRPLNF